MKGLTKDEMKSMAAVAVIWVGMRIAKDQSRKSRYKTDIVEQGNWARVRKSGDLYVIELVDESGEWSPTKDEYGVVISYDNEDDALWLYRNVERAMESQSQG